MIKTYLYLLAMFCATTCSAQVADSATLVKSLNKCWRVLSHEYSLIYGLEVEEIKQLSKQRLCFRKDSASMFHGVLYEPRYSAKKMNAEQYARSNFDCTKQKMGIGVDSVYEVTISSVTKPTETEPAHKMTDVIIYDGLCIYVVVDGVIFKLFDADAKIQGRSSN